MLVLLIGLVGLAAAAEKDMSIMKISASGRTLVSRSCVFTMIIEDPEEGLEKIVGCAGMEMLPSLRSPALSG